MPFDFHRVVFDLQTKANFSFLFRVCLISFFRDHFFVIVWMNYFLQSINFTDCSDCSSNIKECPCYARLPGLVPYTNYTIFVRSRPRNRPGYWSADQSISVRTAQSGTYENIFFSKTSE